MPYIGKSPTGTGVRSRYYFTASGGETSLSGASDSGATLSFTDGAYVDVSLNGVALVAGTDYNTTTANTIGGLSALAASDVVEILVYDIFTVADTVPASSGGTFSGGVTMGGALNLQSPNFKMTDLTTNAFYRTGTFVPHWSTANVTTAYQTDAFGSGSYITQVGSYIRIGNLVRANFHLQLDYSAASYANGSAGGQSLSIYGLPFNVKNVSTYFPQTSTIYFHFADQGWTGMSLMGFGQPNHKYVLFRYTTATGTNGEATIDHPFDPTPRAHDSEMLFDITYETDEA